MKWHREANHVHAKEGILRRLLRHVYNKWEGRRLPGEDILVSWDGQQILARSPRESVIGRELFLRGVWEPEVTRYLCKKAAKGLTVLDVGADIGYYTLLLAKRVGNEGKVYAFEPIPDARKQLEYNISLNGYTNVAVCSFALFSSNGIAVLEEPLRVSRLNPEIKCVKENDIQVETKIFDEWARENRLKRMDLVKIDVEGAELDVLYGMQESIKKYCPVLVIEVHPGHLTRFNYCPDDLVRFLRSMGYSLSAVDKPSLSFENGNITIACAYPVKPQSV